MATRVHYKRFGLALGLAVILVCVLFVMRRPSPATASAIAMRFIGYTNPPNAGPDDHLRFALFSVSNQAGYDIRWHGDSVEVEGRQYNKGRTVNSSLPGYTYDPVLKVRESMNMAVGEPFYATEFGRWRFLMSFSRYSIQERWFWFLWRHKLPTGIGPLVLADSERILNPSNHVTVTTEWLTK